VAHARPNPSVNSGGALVTEDTGPHEPKGYTNVNFYHPSLGSRLNAPLTSRLLSSLWAERLWSAAQLPDRLQRSVRGLVPHFESCTDEDRLLFAVAREHRGRGIPVSAPRWSDAAAHVYSAGTWGYDRQCGWWLLDLLERMIRCLPASSDLSVPS
jgi:hypothetical protein